MAPGWDDCAEIDARRIWLAKLRESAFREAIDTAIEIGRPAVALHHAHQLALLLETDGNADCQYALLLADNGRADAALLYCQGVRDSLEADDARALVLLDQTVHSIQQQSNRSVAADRPANGAMREKASGFVSRQCVAAPMRRLIGYELLAQVCTRCIEDPFGLIVSLVGPPGCGKSLLASTVAHRAQSSLVGFKSKVQHATSVRCAHDPDDAAPPASARGPDDDGQHEAAGVQRPGHGPGVGPQSIDDHA